MNIDVRYPMGRIVYLVTDDEQQPRIVTGYIVRPGTGILYMLTCGPSESNHYELEISSKKNILI